MQRLVQIGSRGATSGLLTAFGAWFGLGNALDTTFNSKTQPILQSKFVENQTESDQKSKKKRIIEIDIIFYRCSVKF